MLSKEEIQGLRNLPPDLVERTLQEAGVPLYETDRKIRNGLDVAIYRANWPYQDAVENLAMFFPDAVQAGRETGLDTCQAAVEAARKQAEADGKVFRDYRQGEFGHDFRQDFFKWFRGLMLASVDIHTSISREAQAWAIKAGMDFRDAEEIEDPDKGHYIPRLNMKEATLADVLRLTPHILSIAAAGRTEEAPTTIYCGPRWPEGKVGIMVDDLKDESFLQKFPPTAIVDTSDRAPQAFYVLDRKYPEQKFYDDFMTDLNARYGDPKIRRQGWDTRMPGLYNRKRFMQDGSGRTPKCRLRESSSRYPVEMEKMIDQYRLEWVERQEEAPSRPEVRAKIPATASVSALDASGESYGLKSQKELMERLDFAYDDAVSEAEGMKAACALLEEVPIPEYIFQTGQACEARSQLVWGETNRSRTGRFGGFGYVDRSKVDAMTARVLYHAGATPHEVYSYLLHHSCQDEEIVERENGYRCRVRSDAERDRLVRRTALNMAPATWFSFSRRADTYPI